MTLCSDMGLGKTLQSICIIAGDHHTKTTIYKVICSEISRLTNNTSVHLLQNLIEPPGTNFSKVPKSFCTRKAVEKSQMNSGSFHTRRFRRIDPMHKWLLLYEVINIVCNDPSSTEKLFTGNCLHC